MAAKSRMENAIVKTLCSVDGFFSTSGMGSGLVLVLVAMTSANTKVFSLESRLQTQVKNQYMADFTPKTLQNIFLHIRSVVGMDGGQRLSQRLSSKKAFSLLTSGQTDINFDHLGGLLVPPIDQKHNFLVVSRSSLVWKATMESNMKAKG